MESRRIEGISRHETILSFGFIASERLPYLKAAFNRGNPEAILEREKRSQEKRSLDDHGKTSGDSLSTGTYKLEVVQYEGDNVDGTVTMYKAASYGVKEKQMLCPKAYNY